MDVLHKTQLKALKRLSRSELLEVMLALKRENDILMVENTRLKTVKHRLERNLEEITETLRRIERGAEAVYGGTADGSYSEIAFGAGDSPPEESAEDFEPMFDGFIDEVTDR